MRSGIRHLHRCNQPAFCGSLIGWSGLFLSCALTSSAWAGLEVISLGKTYQPDSRRIAIQQTAGDIGGSTSVRNVDAKHLEWKTQGYFQRNRDIGQVFTTERGFRLDAIVLRTGGSDAAVLAGTPGAKVFVQFYEVIGEPQINDNGTPGGAKAKHGFSTNHRCDDFIEGVTYRPLGIVRGGRFPDIPPTQDMNGIPAGGQDAAGKRHYLRWRFDGDDRHTFESGKRYAFMIGLEEPGPERGFTLSNSNKAAVDAPPAIADQHDRYHGGWALRREGDGSLPPAMSPGQTAPADPAVRSRLVGQSLFAPGDARYRLKPTTDGYPDVDTYRDLEFYLEVSW